MSYTYVAVDQVGAETRGTLDVPSQLEAVRRIKEMGLFPTKVFAPKPQKRTAKTGRGLLSKRRFSLPSLGSGVSAPALAVFTRQTATLMEAGMPLLRGLRLLHEQEQNRRLQAIIEDLAESLENGASFGEALERHPKVFNSLYVSMVKAGELGGMLDMTLKRLSEFMDKAQKIKGKVKAALFYPCAVLLVAAAILVVMLVFVVPRFELVFDGLMGGKPLPPFTMLVLKLSYAVKGHYLAVAAACGALAGLVAIAKKTRLGREVLDRVKIRLPALGPVFKKLAIARFARTLGTLISSGVPILRALNILKETSGNVVVARIIGMVHDRVKEGDPIAPTLRASGVFPPMVAGMVDVGEQTGALPDMLIKVADTYDDEVDNAANAMTSLLEPIMIVFLAVVVGGIVIAMFLPLVSVVTNFNTNPGAGEE